MTRRKYYVGKVAKVAKAAEDWLGNQRHQGNRSLNAFISQSVNDTVYVEKLRDSFDRSCSSQFLVPSSIPTARADHKQIISAQVSMAS